MIKPEQSSHWYKRKTGEPCYEIVGKNGNLRAPTIKDAIELDCVPSVTTILKVLSKPGLEAWKQNQILLSALTHPNPSNLPAQDLAALIIEESKKEAELAALRGSEIHSLIERGFSSGSWVGNDIQPFLHFSAKHQMKAIHLEKCFANSEYGGRIDFIGMFDGKLSLIDFKTQNTKGKPIKFYQEWALQLAAYNYGIDEEIEQVVSIVIASDDVSKIDFKIWGNGTLSFETFSNALKIWQWQNEWHDRIVKHNNEMSELLHHDVDGVLVPV